MPWEAPFSQDNARAAIVAAVCWSDALRALGYEPKGHNIRTLQRWARRWSIDVSHFDPNIGRARAARARRTPLDQILVKNSPFYCKMDCWGKVAAERYRGVEHPERRKVPRASYEQLLADLQTMSFCAVGRKYGVSDNGIRKWLKWYERQRERAEAEADDTDPERRAA